MGEQRKFKRVLAANRGEIAIRIFRACKELGIRSVAIYSEEDKNTLFRTKADQSYQIGKGKAPVDAYLAIDEIIELAKAKGIRWDGGEATDRAEYKEEQYNKLAAGLREHLNMEKIYEILEEGI